MLGYQLTPGSETKSAIILRYRKVPTGPAHHFICLTVESVDVLSQVILANGWTLHAAFLDEAERYRDDSET
jgi:hypothetical protein